MDPNKPGFWTGFGCSALVKTDQRSQISAQRNRLERLKFNQGW
jgi:hypothetical protein